MKMYPEPRFYRMDNISINTLVIDLIGDLYRILKNNSFLRQLPMGYLLRLK